MANSFEKHALHPEQALSSFDGDWFWRWYAIGNHNGSADPLHQILAVRYHDKELVILDKRVRD
ncbi:MAG TPA: hypothetical protein VGW38_20895 [Chloroflexota bacterium]|nr:hypothetical protein [Chloroflexota bacterium]